MDSDSLLAAALQASFQNIDHVIGSSAAFNEATNFADIDDSTGVLTGQLNVQSMEKIDDLSDAENIAANSGFY
jgi:hypothetical protein